jgi:hypothetical protein
MIGIEYIIIIVILAGLCLMNWRLGMFICLASGFLQDPLRKVVPDEPIIFSVLVVLFLSATLAGAVLNGMRINFRPIHAWNPTLRLPLQAFVCLVVIQSGMTVLRTGSVILGGIGLLAYLSPLPAVLLGYHFFQAGRNALKFMRVYLFFSLLMASGIYLSQMGYEWQVLRPVGDGLIAFSPSGEQLVLFPGFLRTVEVAAWHAALSVCLLILLQLTGKYGASKWVLNLLILFFMGALLFTGRRKFWIEIIVFASAYGFMLTYFRKGATKLALSLLVLGVGIATLTYTYLGDEESAAINPYIERGASVQQDGPERLVKMTINSFQVVIDRNGVFGSGAGTGSQGAQYFGGGAELVGAAAEGGLGKVLAELGVPGLLLLTWLLISLSRYLWSVVIFVKDGDPLLARLIFWLLAFFLSNGTLYLVAHQVFGDLFVLILLGFFLGFALAVPRLQRHEFSEAIHPRHVADMVPTLHRV